MRAARRAILGAAVIGVALAGLWAASRSTEGEHVEILPEPESRPGQEECPLGELEGGSGPAMVRVPAGFCVDATEVTRSQYAAWLDASPSAVGQPGACGGNNSFEPGCAWPPNGNQGELPVVCVDWCDARAYCEAAGKRLCGRVGDGDGYPWEEYADPTVSEWTAACTSGGAHEYAYGDELDRARCRGGDAEDHTTWGLTDVGSLDGCRSPDEGYGELRDLSGNAAEWDNACEGDAPDAPCRVRGGSFEHQHHGLRCAMGQNLRWPRDRQQHAVGFRCCAD